jgi:hypothetical protein
MVRRNCPQLTTAAGVLTVSVDGADTGQCARTVSPRVAGHLVRSESARHCGEPPHGVS